nr:12512_t:CDS:2 [Entrophospora candida]
MPKKRKGHALKDITNELEHKKPKPNEALRLLLQLCPDLNSQKIYFFPCTNVHEEGILLYDQKDNLYYVHDILKILSVKEFQTRIQQRVHENSLYASVIIKEISGGVELMEIKYNDTIK